MKVSDFQYTLPPELIAQFPAERRDASRMLVMHRQTGRCELATFADFAKHLHPGDCLIRNNTRVIAARLHGRRQETGGRVEAFMLQELSPGVWHCMLRPGRRLLPGTRICIDDCDVAEFEVLKKCDDGTAEVRFNCTSVLGLLEQAGSVPLPPYIQRPPRTTDAQRYQTVYAEKPGAVAAPTAGLHFTPEVLTELEKKGVTIADVTLHVGAGTFRPVSAENIEDHRMHEEVYELSRETADLVNSTRRQGGRVVAVGTTSVRVLESCVDSTGNGVVAGAGRTRIFLYPPQKPRVVDALLTNFHLPCSTLLMLVSCFSSAPHVLAAYELAKREEMRFYSYGDCMLLLPEDA